MHCLAHSTDGLRNVWPTQAPVEGYFGCVFVFGPGPESIERSPLLPRRRLEWTLGDPRSH